MKNNYLSEISIAIILIIILIIFLNPIGFLMPTPLVSMLIILLSIVFGVFASIIWRERSIDERENYHKLFAGHLAFLTGSTILVIGIIIQEYNHSLDPWMVYVLLSMIIAKVIARIYSKNKL